MGEPEEGTAVAGGTAFDATVETGPAVEGDGEAGASGEHADADDAAEGENSGGDE